MYLIKIIRIEKKNNEDALDDSDKCMRKGNCTINIRAES